MKTMILNRTEYFGLVLGILILFVELKIGFLFSTRSYSLFDIWSLVLNLLESPAIMFCCRCFFIAANLYIYVGMIKDITAISPVIGYCSIIVIIVLFCDHSTSYSLASCDDGEGLTKEEKYKMLITKYYDISNYNGKSIATVGVISHKMLPQCIWPTPTFLNMYEHVGDNIYANTNIKGNPLLIEKIWRPMFDSEKVLRYPTAILYPKSGVSPLEAANWAMDNSRAVSSIITQDFRESLKMTPDSIICFEKLKSLPELDVSNHDFFDDDVFNLSKLESLVELDVTKHDLSGDDEFNNSLLKIRGDFNDVDTRSHII